MSSPTDPLTATISSYDEAPYPAGSHAETTPNRLGAMGRLFGLATSAPSTARVLEIGCADGSNLLPMVERAPEARFVGIDASKVQIEKARKAQESAGLKNVELRCQNILEFPTEGVEFDYVIVHGIFSWVPDAVRDRILQICEQCLAPKGVAYISYNAYPGWHMRQSLRDMMLYHTRAFTDPKAKVGQARALLKFLVDSVPKENNAFGVFLAGELELLAKQPDNYLRHDILEEVNTPFYFHEFIERASRHRLQYLSEASIATMLADNFPATVQTTLGQVTKNIIAQEQYMDFLRNRPFRQTLLCRTGVNLQRNLTAGLLRQFAFQNRFKTDLTPIDYSPLVPVTFSATNGQQLTTSDPLVKGLFSVFAESPARILTFDNLLSQARARARAQVGALLASRSEVEEETVLANLMKLFGTGFVDICVEPIGISLKVPHKPEASPLMRYQALNSRFVTNRVHVGLPGDIFGRYLINVCDGTRTVEEIVEAMIGLIQGGKMQITGDGVVLTEAAALRQLVAPRVDQILQNLARNGVFAPQ